MDFFSPSNESLLKHNIREDITLLLICIPRFRITRVNTSGYVKLNLSCINVLNKDSCLGAVTELVGRKVRTQPHKPSNIEEMIVLLEIFFCKLCQVALTLESNNSRESTSEIKLVKCHSGKDVAHSGPQNFTVMILSASIWFQYLFITGKQVLFKGTLGRRWRHLGKQNTCSDHIQLTAHLDRDIASCKEYIIGISDKHQFLKLSLNIAR